MSVSIIGGGCGQVITGLGTFTNPVANVVNDTLVLFFAALAGGATSTVTAVSDSVNGSWANVDALADAVVDGTHHGSGSTWILKNAAAATLGAATVTVTLSSGATYNGYTYVVSRGANNTTPIGNSGAAHAIGSASGSGADPMPFTTQSTADTVTSDQTIGFAAAWANSQTDDSVAGSGCTKIVSYTGSFNGANMCSCSLNTGSVNGSNSVNGSVGNGAGVAGMITATIVLAAPGGGGSPPPDTRPYILNQASKRSSFY